MKKTCWRNKSLIKKKCCARFLLGELVEIFRWKKCTSRYSVPTKWISAEHIYKKELGKFYEIWWKNITHSFIPNTYFYKAKHAILRKFKKDTRSAIVRNSGWKLLRAQSTSIKNMKKPICTISRRSYCESLRSCVHSRRLGLARHVTIDRHFESRRIDQDRGIARVCVPVRLGREPPRRNSRSTRLAVTRDIIQHDDSPCSYMYVYT